MTTDTDTSSDEICARLEKELLTEINELNINRSINDNIEKGQYGSTLGSLGQALNDNKLSVAVLGNADTGLKEEDFNRNIASMAMDNLGRVNAGNIDDINTIDNKMHFAIKTDYDKLVKETAQYYQENDVVFVELGDTYRLDLYKPYLNEESYNKMEKQIHKNIDLYMKELMQIVDNNDKIYIISAFPKDIDYKNKRRLSPVIKLDGSGKGILSSSTTRRDGIIGNVDIAVDILNDFGLTSETMVGRSLDKIEKDDNLEFINYEYSKIVSISTVRSNIINNEPNLVIPFIKNVLANDIISEEMKLKIKKRKRSILKRYARTR